MTNRWALAALGTVVAGAAPAIIVGNALWVLLNPWLVDAQYALPGFPDDRLGLEDGQRSDLAVVGVRSVRPLDDGVALLRDARLPEGQGAFTEREVSHMGDVRGVIVGFVTAWAVALSLAFVAAAALRRYADPGALRDALGRGGMLTLGLIGFVGIAALIDFDGFFGAFHGVFFEGDSWRFADNDTLLQLDPETFWTVASAGIVAAIIVQAGALVLLRRRPRRAAT